MNSSNGPVSETGGERWTSTPADRNDRLRRTSTFRDGALDLWQGRSVAVIGAGVIGGRVGPEIVRSGATVAVFDPGRGRHENLGTQVVQPGRDKVETILEICDAIAPGRAQGFAEDIRHAGIGVLREFDLLMDCSDDPNLAVDLTKISNGLGVPLLRLAVDGTGEREFGRVLTSHGGAGNACQICPYSVNDLAGSFSPNPCPDRPAAGPAPTLAGAAISMAVVGLGLLQAQRLLGGNDVERVLDREIYLDFDNMEISPLELGRSSGCLSGHVLWELCDLDRDAAETTLGDLFAVAGEKFGASSETSDIVLEPHLHPLCVAAYCDCGAAKQAVGTIWAAAPRCPECEGRMHWRRDLKWRRFAPRHVEALEIGARSLLSLGLPERGAMVTAHSKSGNCLRFILN